MPRPTDADLVIVGASFAGLAAARTAAARGLCVIVLEAKLEPGARVHTTGILVPEAADEIDVPHHLTRAVPGVRLYAPNLASADLFSPGYAFLTTRTAELLRWMAAEAERAGAEIRCGVRFTGAERLADGRLRVAPLGVTARLLVGADGARSAVARAFGLARNRRFLTGLEVELEPLAHDPLDTRFLHCFADSRLAPGYIGWAAPGPDAIQVGLAVRHGAKPDLAAFLARTEPVFGWSRRRVVGRRSGLIPAGGPVFPFACPGVLLIGDAAGLVSPMTAGGIRTALQWGRRAAAAAADHLLLGGPDPASVLLRQIPRFRVKGLMRRALDASPPNWALDLLLASAPMRRLAEEVYFHKRGVGGVSREDYARWLAERDGMLPPTGGLASPAKP